MAKTSNPTDPRVNNPAPPTVINAATPDNTPIPGGGRWRWDIALPGWVDVGASAADPETPLE